MRHSVFFKKLRDKSGYIHGLCTENRIYINLMTNTSPARTYIHELLHLRHPEWSETRVEKQESVMWNKMDTRKRFNVYKKLFSRRFRGG